MSGTVKNGGDITGPQSHSGHVVAPFFVIGTYLSVRYFYDTKGMVYDTISVVYRHTTNNNNNNNFQNTGETQATS